MSYSNWEIYEFSGAPISSTARAALYPSSVSKPSSDAGLYGRRIYGTQVGGAPYQNDTFCVVSNTYQSGSFVNVPAKKAVRLQCMMRLDTCGAAGVGTSGGAGSGGIFLRAKTLVGISGEGGYGFGLKRSINSDNFILVFHTSNTWQTGNRYHTLFETASAGTWYNLRMEVYPVGTSADIIKCFKETTIGSNSWQQLGTDIVIPSTDANYINWGENRKFGLFARSDYTGVFLSGWVVDGYVDKLSITVANTGSV